MDIIERYFALTAGNDVEAFVAPFTDDADVVDDGHRIDDHRERAMRLCWRVTPGSPHPRCDDTPGGLQTPADVAHPMIVTPS